MSTSVGRIVYFEPNELFGTDNQPVNQEDLTKYVNLSVRVPSRIYNGNQTKKYESILKGTPFTEIHDNVEYTKMYLTDNYVNVSYLKYGSDEQINVGELFGIESIDISFDVQFFPQVVINFIDVKGFGLMSTMEYNYEQGKINDITAKSFFTSLFDFPYPIFTLEVKGYYGKSMAFDLALKDFHTAFDSTTGNFRTSVTFVGHLYGVYSDIPMTYLMISPYIDYKGVLNADISEELVGETWKKIGNNDILPTFIGVLDKFKELLSGGTFNSEGIDVLTDYQENNERISKLTEIKELYEGIIEYCKRNLSGLTYDYDTKCVLDYIDNGTYTRFSDLHFGGIKNYIENEMITVIAKSGETLYTIFENNEYWMLEQGIDSGIYDEAYRLTTISKTINTGTNCDKYIYIRFPDIFQKLNSVTLEINTINDYSERNSEVLNQAVIKVVGEKLGFDPTIKNMYKILYKHLDCFSRQFFSVIKSVDKRRNKTSLNLPSSVYTDVVDYENGSIIPPFPMFAVKEGDKINVKYPGDIDKFYEQPEISMVENIYSSLKYMVDKIDNANREIAEAISVNIEGEAVNLTFGSFFADIDPKIDMKTKNYQILKNGYSGNELRDGIRDIFLSRFNMFLDTHFHRDLETNDELYFIETESKLFLNAFSKLDENVLIGLKNLGANDNALVTQMQTLQSYINYNPKEKSSSYTIENHNFDSVVRIFKKGSYNECVSYVNSLEFDKSYIHIFEQIPYKSEIFNSRYISHPRTIYVYGSCGTKQEPSGFWEGYRLNRRYFKELVQIDYDDCSDTWSKGAAWTNDCYTYFMEFYYIKNTDTFFSSSSSNKYDLIDWACSKHQEKTESYIECRSYTDYESQGGCGDGIFAGPIYDRTDSGTYRWVYSDNSKLNKMMVMSFAHLLAIGEMVYQGNYAEGVDTNGKNYEDYFIPITHYESDSDITLSSGADVSFKKYFVKHCSVLSNKLSELYQYYFSISDSKPEIYDLLVGSGSRITRGSIEDALNYWVVISKEHKDRSHSKSSNLTNKEIAETWDKFVEKIYTAYGFSYDIVKNSKKKDEAKNEILELKTNIYYTLKTLYDKWYCGLNEDFFNLYEAGNNVKNDGEFGRVSFLTTTFNDISNDLMIDIESFVNQILSIKTNPETIQKSVLSYMAKTAQDNQSTFLVLPTDIFGQDMQDAFRPHNFYDSTLKHDIHGSSYIVMYNGDVSHNLDIPGSPYKHDGYTIADYEDGQLKITQEAASIMEIRDRILSEHDHEIQAFGVTYGMQNQNFFKNITVDTQTPQITDYSIANILSIAESGSETANGSKTMVKVQSLYPVYANRSYNCTVEMMGCMYITPLMHFQLNNIPMFKGAYVITNVEHKITPNDFITTFTGVRVSKYKIPVNKQVMNLNRLGKIISTGGGSTQTGGGSTQTGGGSTQAGGSYTPTTLQPVSGMNVSKDIINLDPTGIYFKGYNGTLSGGWCRTGHDCDMSARSTMRNVLANTGHDTINSCGNEGGSYDRSIRLVTEKRDDDYIYYYHSDGINMQAKYRQTIQLIKEHLHNGYPVRVSVNHTFNKGINEGTSDHFVAIYAYGIVEGGEIDFTENYNDYFPYFAPNNFTKIKNGKVEYFRFYESGSNRQEVGVNARNIFFYVDDSNPLFYCPSDRINRKLDVANVFPYPDNLIDSKSFLSFPLENYRSGVYDDGKNVKVPRENYRTYSI